MRTGIGLRLLRPAAAVLAVVLTAGCAAAVPSPSPTPIATPQLIPSPVPAATPAATPTPTPAPTPPPPAKLVLRVLHHDYFDSWTTTSLVTDGRLTSPSEAGWQVQVLSPAGVAQVKEAVQATGLFEQSHDVALEYLPNADIRCTDGLGLTFGSTIELQTDAGLISVGVTHGRSEFTCYVPSAERDALEALLSRLDSLDAWVPADAWVELAPRPAETERYRVLVTKAAWQDAFGDQPDLRDLEWPLAGTPTTYGTAPVEQPYGATWRCEVVTADAAASVLGAVADASAALTPSNRRGYATGTLFRDHEEDAAVAIIMEAMRPDEAGCADANPEILNCWSIAGVQPFSCATP